MSWLRRLLVRSGCVCIVLQSQLQLQLDFAPSAGKVTLLALASTAEFTGGVDQEEGAAVQPITRTSDDGGIIGEGGEEVGAEEAYHEEIESALTTNGLSVDDVLIDQALIDKALIDEAVLNGDAWPPAGLPHFDHVNGRMLPPATSLLSRGATLARSKRIKRWPAIQPSAKGRGRERTFVCSQHQACPAGSTCHITCVTRSCEQEPVVHWRLIGHRVLECVQTGVWQTARHCGVQYDVECYVGDAGPYDLQGIVMYENYALAVQAPPLCAVSPIGLIFTVPGVWVEEKKMQGGIAEAAREFAERQVEPPPPPPVCTPEQLSRGGGEGRWVPSLDTARNGVMGDPYKGGGGTANIWWWQPWECSVRPLNHFDGPWNNRQPVKPLEVIIVGDSHQARLSEYLAQRFPPQLGLMKVVYVAASGLVGHGMEKKYEQGGYLECADGVGPSGGMGPIKYNAPLFDMQGGGGVIAKFKEVCENVTKQAKREKQLPFVVVESGHWDLRDSSVEHYERYFKVLLHEVNACTVLENRIIIRTAPAYSHRRDRWAKREYRTNTKLQIVAQFVKDSVALYAPSVLILDSFAFTYPRLMESCDTHHYMCLGNRIDQATGPELRSTVPVLMQMLFPEIAQATLSV